MKNYKFFMKSADLLSSSKEEKPSLSLFLEAQEGKQEAINKLTIYHLRLVFLIVGKYFQSVNYDNEDLVSIGIFGLLKAIKTYIPTKGVKFSAYATKCIKNEILMFLRKLLREKDATSIYNVVCSDDDGKELLLEDTIKSDYELIVDYEQEEMYQELRHLINELPDKKREIIKLYYGFYNNKVHTQTEIASIFNTSQRQISRIIKDTLKKLKMQLLLDSVTKLQEKQQGEKVLSIKFKDKSIISNSH